MQHPNYLLKLFFDVVGFNQDGLYLADGDDPSFHNAGIFGQENPPFHKSDPNKSIILCPVDEKGVISHHPEPPGQAAHIDISDEFRLHNFNDITNRDIQKEVQLPVIKSRESTDNPDDGPHRKVFPHLIGG
jgi:hypothetical protein